MEQFERLVVTVSQLNNYIKGLFEQIPVFEHVYVSGEISNFTNHYRSGHFYFSLKDDKSVIKAVMFRTYAGRLRFEPENGMQVLVKARLGVFERDGIYQLYVEDIQPKGIGSLSLAFEQLKKKLAAEGLFDEQYKKAIPRYPERIGVITSPTGAAIRDITNILSRRYPAAQMVLMPVTVQGEEAPRQLCAALEKLNAQNECDVIILGRGGGSMEDLWAFNDAALARKIFESRIPVISAVGHETDFTIADFVADLRAPTPSAAAELAVPLLADVQLDLKAKQASLTRAVLNKLQENGMRLEVLKASPCLKSPDFMIQENRQRLDTCFERMDNALHRRLESEMGRYNALCSKLDALSPLKVLARGYCVMKKDGKNVFSVDAIAAGDCVSIQLVDGNANALIEKITKE